MAYPQTLKKKTLVARSVAAIAVLELPVETKLPEGEAQTSKPSHT